MNEQNEISISEKAVSIIPVSEDDTPAVVFSETFPSDTYSLFGVRSTLELVDFAIVISCSCEKPAFDVSETGTLNLTRVDIATGSESVTFSAPLISVGATATLTMPFGPGRRARRRRRFG